MSRFNSKVVSKDNETLTVNKAGGEAFALSSKAELVSILLTSMLKDGFYEKADETLKRLVEAIKKVDDKKFIAKAAIYARDKYGMRSVSHVVAGELAKVVKGETWTKNFYNKVIVRVDDMTEIMSYYLTSVKANKDKKFRPIPNSLIKGFKKAFTRFDRYQLAKYRAENKSVKLIDLINLVHPKPSEKNGYVYIEKTDWDKFLLSYNEAKEKAEKKGKKYKALPETSIAKDCKIKINTLSAATLGFLKNEVTTEAVISSAGQEAKKKIAEEKLSEAEAEQLVSDLKGAGYKELITTRKMGYMALLKNLRNILEHAQDSVDAACEMLVDPSLIAKSRLLPFRFTTAYEEIQKLSNTGVNKVLKAISQATEISLKNVPVFDGKTAVVIDVSGSMRGKPAEIASLFGAVLMKANPNAELVTFDTSADYRNVNIADSLMTISKSLRFNGGGTDFHCIFKTLNKAYDRIIILSDMQGWVGNYNLTSTFKTYKSKFKCNPYIYSFDLQGLGTTQFPESKVFAMFGFSDKIFDTMKHYEEDKEALVTEIEKIEI